MLDRSYEYAWNNYVGKGRMHPDAMPVWFMEFNRREPDLTLHSDNRVYKIYWILDQDYEDYPMSFTPGNSVAVVIEKTARQDYAFSFNEANLHNFLDSFGGSIEYTS